MNRDPGVSLDEVVAVLETERSDAIDGVSVAHIRAEPEAAVCESIDNRRASCRSARRTARLALDMADYCGAASLAG